MEIDALDGDDHDGARQLAADRKTLQQIGIDRDCRAPVHPQGLADARNEKQQRDARIAHKVAHAVDAVVAGAVGNGECLLVEDADEAGRIALRRTVEPLRAAGRDRDERRGFDQLGRRRRDLLDLLGHGARPRLAIKPLELLDRFDLEVLPRHAIPRSVLGSDSLLATYHSGEPSNGKREKRLGTVGRIEGDASVSADGMIADRAGVMPPELIVPADQVFFERALDNVDIVLHGRLSQESHPRSAERRRIIVTRTIAGVAQDAAHPNIVLWNPAGAALGDAVAKFGIANATIGGAGGSEVFGMFLPLFNLFYLSRVPDVLLPEGRAGFSRRPRGGPDE